MTDAPNTDPTWLALAREAGLAAEHIGIGATALGRANYAQEAYYAQAFFALSVGFERAAKLEIIRMCDAVEVLNAACSEEENIFALKVARSLGMAEVEKPMAVCTAGLKDGVVLNFGLSARRPKVSVKPWLKRH